MAGSYLHIVDDDGNLLTNERFVGMIENLGDAYEMAEECYGMIQLLSGGDPARIEWARQHYRLSLERRASG